MNSEYGYSPPPPDAEGNKTLDPEVIAPETSNRNFDAVVFGHPLYGFDRDQAIAYFLGCQAGIIDESTPTIFSSDPTPDQLTNPRTLVLEGFDQSNKDEGTARLGNFGTGKQDEPAAALLWQTYSRNFNEHPQKAALADLVRWLKTADTGNPSKKLQALSNDSLRLITPILYGLKLQNLPPNELLQQTNELLNLIVTNGDPNMLRDRYLPQLQMVFRKRKADFVALREQAKDPQKLKTITTFTGTTIAFFDVRGLRVEAGGSSVAFRETSADLVFLIDDVYDPENPDQVVGTQIIIKEPRKRDGVETTPETSLPNLHTTLAERLTVSEKLFGHGLKLRKTFGGHPGIVAAPAWIGSKLNPEDVWVAIQDFFNAPRYSKTEIDQQALALAEKVGTEKGLVDLAISNAPHQLAEWHIKLTIPNSKGEQKVVTIPERDLALYQQVLTDNERANQALLLEKTTLTEPEAIAAARNQVALDRLTTAIDTNMATQALFVLDDVNTDFLKTLKPEMQLSLLKVLGQNDAAISQVWDKNNLVFTITESIPDWIINDLEKYKAERFRYISVPSKIDTHLFNFLWQSLLTNQNSEQLHDLAQTCLTILTSDTYKKSHQEPGYDSLLSHLVMMLGHQEFPETLAGELLTTLLAKYPLDEMKLDWQRVPPTYLAALLQRFPGIGDALQTLVPADTEVVSFIQDIEIKFPSQEGLDLSANTQTIMVEIGRPMIQDFLTKGSFIDDSATQKEHPQQFVGEVKLARTLKLESREDKQIADLIVAQIKAVAQLVPHQRIRLVCGSFPNMLTRVLVKKIAQLDADIQNRLVFCDFNFQDTQYYDHDWASE